MTQPSSSQRRGLGRGLGSLIPTGPARPAPTEPDVPELVGGSYFAELPLASITPNRVQPRQVFDEEAMSELVTSLKEVGLLQPVVVRPAGDEGFELVMGERRWR